MSHDETIDRFILTTLNEAFAKGDVAFPLLSMQTLTVWKREGFRRKPFMAGALLSPLEVYKSPRTGKLIFKFSLRHPLDPDIEHVEILDKIARAQLNGFDAYVQRILGEEVDKETVKRRVREDSTDFKAQQERYKDDTKFGSW